MASGGGGRRRRGKVKRKTKYLSLSRHLNAAKAAKEVKEEDGATESMLLEFSPAAAVEARMMPEEDGDGGGQQQMEPFALHPEAPCTLFAAAPSLTDILGASPTSGGISGGGGSPPSCAPSPDAASGGFEGEEEEDLVRRALRGRERWVYCCRSTSSSSPPTTTTSSSCSSGAAAWSSSSPPPLLKLDYDEILAAWNGRGSLYIGAAGQSAGLAAAPKLELELLDSVLVEVAPSAWSAPETSKATAAGRAERVQRYKEKRQARLFSKRIRYEVRRINAVRRPRFKGRFIKEKGLGAVAMAADGGELEPAAS